MPEAEVVGAGGGFERGEHGTLAVALLVPAVAGVNHVGVDVLAVEEDVADDPSVAAALAVLDGDVAVEDEVGEGGAGALAVGLFGLGGVYPNAKL